MKTTALFPSELVLKRNNATTEYCKTSHSYIKRQLKKTGALVGF